MSVKISKAFWKVIGLGMLAGSRTNMAPAVASHILSRNPSKRLSNSPLRFMQSGKVATGLKVLAAGEFLGDKVPGAPNRIEPGGLIFRCLSGSLAGAVIYKAAGNNVYKGALLGAVTAFGATYASYYLRKKLVKKTGIYDPYAGAIEDTLVIGAGVYLTKIS